MGDKYESPRERVLAAVHILADADESNPDEWRQAWERFRRASLHWHASTAGGRGKLAEVYRVKHPQAARTGRLVE